MSERLSNSALDALIDDAARSLTASAAPADLRARVFAQIQAAPPAWRANWWLPAAAAVVLLVAALVYVRNGGPGAAPADEVATTAVTPPAVTTPVTTTAAVQSGSPVQDGSRAPAVAEAAPAPRSVQIVESALPPGFESIAIAATPLPALTVEGLIPIATMDVEAIPMESLGLDALGTN